jgi:hypothetical protein
MQYLCGHVAVVGVCFMSLSRSRERHQAKDEGFTPCWREKSRIVRPEAACASTTARHRVAVVVSGIGDLRRQGHRGFRSGVDAAAVWIPLCQLVYRQALLKGRNWPTGASGDPSLYPDQRKWFTCGTIRISDGRYQARPSVGTSRCGRARSCRAPIKRLDNGRSIPHIADPSERAPSAVGSRK